jgi:hypothetical protein
MVGVLLGVFFGVVLNTHAAVSPSVRNARPQKVVTPKRAAKKPQKKATSPVPPVLEAVVPEPTSETKSESPSFSLPEGITLDALVGHYESWSDFGYDSFQSSALINTSSQIRLTDSFQFKFAGWGGYFRETLARPDEAHSRADIREASLAFSKNGFDFEVGQLYLPWGKTDGVNPTDYLTGRDYRFISSEEIFKRRGAPGALLSFSPKAGTSPFRFDLVALGRYAQNELFVPASAVPAGITLNQTTPLNHEKEFAGKMSVTGEGWDFSLSGFKGKNHQPQFVFDGTEVKKEYLDRTAIGGDFSKAFSEWVFRLEAAYTNQEYLSEMRSEPNHVDAVVGLERGFGDRARLIVQFIYRYYDGWTDPEVTYSTASPQATQIGRSLATANALLLNYQNESNPGATLTYQFTSANDAWKLDLTGIGYFLNQDFLLRPLVGYKLSDHFRIQIGAEIYGGPEDRPLGALSTNSSIFSELRAFF